MNDLILKLLIFHGISGGVALLTGGIAIFAKKGKKLHRKAGKVYVWAMTLVFLTGIFIAGYRENRFLFCIAFLSYYSVFAGIRILKIKQLHRNQSPKWYDWTAGILNALVNIIFLGLGVYYLFVSDNQAAAGLSIFFGLGGLAISYVNLKPFIVRPTEKFHWYNTHIGNMMGGYIATSTAFISTIASRTDFINPYLAFLLPSLIGVPLLIYWQNRYTKQTLKKI